MPLYSWKRFFCHIILIGQLVSCAGLRDTLLPSAEEKYLGKQKVSPRPKDFIAHYIHLGDDFIRSKDINIRPLALGHRKYLEKIVHRLLENNPSIDKDKRRVKVLCYKE